MYLQRERKRRVRWNSGDVNVMAWNCFKWKCKCERRRQSDRLALLPFYDKFINKPPGNWLPTTHLKGKSAGGILVFCSEFYGEFPWERLSPWFLYNLNIIYIIRRYQKNSFILFIYVSGNWKRINLFRIKYIRKLIITAWHLHKMAYRINPRKLIITYNNVNMFVHFKWLISILICLGGNYGSKYEPMTWW